jgi:hypothetical protein
MKTARWILIGVAMLVIWPGAGMAQAAEPVAMVTDLKGNAWMQAGGKDVKLNVLSYLEQGASIRLDSKAMIAITTFSPAAEYAATGPARIELKGWDVRLVGGGKLQRRSLDDRKTNAARQFSVTQRERLTLAAFEMKSLDMGLQLLAPVNAELLNNRPFFKWSAPPEVKRFVVTLFDESDGKLVSEMTVNKSSWLLPGNLSLQRKHQYSWKVRPVLSSEGEATSAGKFSIVDEARSARILQQKPTGKAPFSERLLYAVLLESEGLKLDAADEWELLAAERPDEPMLRVHLKK